MSQREVLNYLIKNCKPQTAKEISLKIGLSQRNTLCNIKKLVYQKILIGKKIKFLNIKRPTRVFLLNKKRL